MLMQESPKKLFKLSDSQSDGLRAIRGHCQETEIETVVSPFLSHVERPSL